MKSLQFLFKTALFVLALLLPSVALAYDFEVDGIYYNIIGNEASVTYQGEDYYYDNNYSGEIVIPETVTYDGVTYPVTAIGDYVFRRSDGVCIVAIAALKQWSADTAIIAVSVDLGLFNIWQGQ